MCCIIYVPIKYFLLNKFCLKCIENMVSGSGLKCISSSKSFGGYQRVYEHFR